MQFDPVLALPLPVPASQGPLKELCLIKESDKAWVSKVFARRATCGEMNICGAAFDYNISGGLYFISFYESSHVGQSKF